MRRVRNIVNTVLVMLLSAAGPVAFAAWVARPVVDLSPALAPVTEAPLLLGSSLANPPADTGPARAVPAPFRLAQASTPAAAPRSIATLYTSGRVNIEDAGGQRRDVDSAGYAYLGGETVTVPSGGLGVLRSGSMSIFLCGGVNASLSSVNGTPVLKLTSGTARAVSNGSGVTVETDTSVVKTGGSGDGMSAVEVSAQSERVVVLQLGGDTSASGANGGETRIGNAVNQVDGAGVTALQWPSGLPTPSEWSIEMTPEALLTGGDYLCRSDELALIAQTGRASDAVDVSPIQVINLGAPPGPAGTSPGQPDASNGFDPNALPPPAAGPASSVIAVAAPAAPGTGTGGGAVASPE